MWRYQTDETSAQKLWQVDWQQGYAAMNGTGTNGLYRSPSAWESANATFKPAVEPTASRAQEPGACWTQPWPKRWQYSGPMSKCQSGFSSGWRTASAPASFSSQPVEATYAQHSLLDSLWKSHSNYCTACHCHISSQPQQPAQLDRELTFTLCTCLVINVLLTQSDRLIAAFLGNFLPEQLSTLSYTHAPTQSCLLLYCRSKGRFL